VAQVEAEELVRAVFDRVHASDPTVSDLYSSDAVRYGHDGRVQRGRPAIAEFYQSWFPARPPFPEIECLLANLPYVGALLRLPEREGRARWCLDLFEIEDGAICSLRVMLETTGAGGG
jgi:hypothetical protein